MKRSIFYVLMILLITASFVWSGDIYDRSNRLWTGTHTLHKTNKVTATVTDGLTLRQSSTGTPAAGLGIGIAIQVEDLGGLEEQGSIDLVATTVTNGQEDFDWIFYQNDNGTVRETLRLIADNDSATVGTRMQLTSTSQETNGVLYPLVLLQSGGTVASGFGIGIDFKAEDADSTETQGQLEFVATTVTANAEDFDFVINQNDNGTVRETLRIIADNDGTTAGTRMNFISTSAETNGVVDSLVIRQSGGTIVDNFGTGISLWLENEDGDVEEKLTVDAVQTDTTNGTEDTDLVVTQFTGAAAAMKETLRLVAASTATTGDTLKFTSNTTETNGLLTTPMLHLVVEESAGEGTTGIGGSIRIDLDGAASGNEEAASIDFILTDGGDGTEDADVIVNQFIAGTVSESLRLDASTGGIPAFTQIDADSAGTATTTSIKRFFYVESCADQADATACFTLPQVTTTGMVKCGFYGTDTGSCEWTIDENGAVIIQRDSDTADCDDANTDAKLNVIDGGGTVAIVNNRLGQTESILCEMTYD